MADAMCGPSNPLQAFQKQASADRSLQQDRLGVRPGASSQNFRSQPHRPGLLDNEFEAFQAGHQAPLFQPPLDLHAARLAPSHQPLRQKSPAMGGWANEFSQLNISAQPALQPQHNMRPMSGWQAEFQQQQARALPAQFQPANAAFNSSASAQTFLQRSNNPMLGYGAASYMDPLSKGKAVSQQKPDLADADAFDREFELFDKSEAAVEQHPQIDPEMEQVLLRARVTNFRARSAELQEAAANKIFEMLKVEQQLPFQTQDLIDESTERKLADELFAQIREIQEKESAVQQSLNDLDAMGGGMHLPPEVDTTRLQRLDGFFSTHNKQGLRNFFSYKGRGIEAIEHLLDPEQTGIEDNDRDINRDAADRELALVAGQVAENLGNNTTDKFKNSEFLKFMRQLNGYEKVLRGDQVVDNDSVSFPHAVRSPVQQKALLKHRHLFPLDAEAFGL